MADELKLWNAVCKTDPAATKMFSGKGGFRGTAISPMYLIRKATELWGPMGGNWGIDILSEKIVEGAPIVAENGTLLGRESIHQLLATIYYPGGRLPAFGQTQFVGRNKYGFFTDEEAPKKSLTDALTKGLSWLGFAADVHEGKFDDVKYVARVRGEFEEASNGKEKQDLRTRALAILKPAAAEGLATLQHAWKTGITEAMREACKADLDALKKEANSVAAPA